MSQPSEIIAPLQSTSGVVPTTGNTSGSSGNLSEVPSTQAGSGANLTPPTTSASANTSTERDILCFFHCLNYRSMAQPIVYAGVLIICSAEPGKFNSLRQLWRILCNFACLIALGYPPFIIKFLEYKSEFLWSSSWHECQSSSCFHFAGCLFVSSFW